MQPGLPPGLVGTGSADPLALQGAPLFIPQFSWAAGVLRAQSETRSGLGAQTVNQGWGSSQVNDSTDRPPAVLGCGRADAAPQFLS